MFWFWWWLLFVFFFLLIPLGYGWGYSGWGPPYYRRGRYGRRARPLDPAEREQLRAEAAAEDEGWALAALVVWWVLVAVAIAWLIMVAAAA